MGFERAASEIGDMNMVVNGIMRYVTGMVEHLTSFNI
jgi:hypothetical protein